MSVDCRSISLQSDYSNVSRARFEGMLLAAILAFDNDCESKNNKNTILIKNFKGVFLKTGYASIKRVFDQLQSRIGQIIQGENRQEVLDFLFTQIELWITKQEIAVTVSVLSTIRGMCVGNDANRSKFNNLVNHAETVLSDKKGINANLKAQLSSNLSSLKIIAKPDSPADSTSQDDHFWPDFLYRLF